MLIGAKTAERKWVRYEIKRAWELKKAVLGIHIHKIQDYSSNQTTKGENPFSKFNLGGKPMSSIVKCYDPQFSTSRFVYNHIKDNIESWIETAHDIRANN